MMGPWRGPAHVTFTPSGTEVEGGPGRPGAPRTTEDPSCRTGKHNAGDFPCPALSYRMGENEAGPVEVVCGGRTQGGVSAAARVQGCRP